jgi:ATP-dependent Clp protease ATP-binding subunit ClpX
MQFRRSAKSAGRPALLGIFFCLAAFACSWPTVRMPSQVAIQMLNFGRLLWYNSQRLSSDREESKMSQAEEQLIAALRDEPSTTLRAALNFSNNGKDVNPIALRVLCLVSHLTLCTTRLGTTIAEVACAVNGDDPAHILEARTAISNLLLRRHIEMRDERGDYITLPRPILNYFAGGSEAPPIAPTESDLRRAWYRSEQAKTKREAKSEAPLSAKQIALRIREQGVVGLESQIRTISSRMVLHTRRAMMIRTGEDSGSSTNQAILIAGPSGSGKTFLTEAACRVCGLPFSIFSSGDLTSEGYVGLSVEDTLRPLLVATRGDVQKARSGLVFLDEFDSKAASPTNWKDITGVCVQKELLRVVEGSKIQIGGRRSGFDQTAPVLFDTTGVMWVLGGAFVGLDKLCAKQAAHGIGFGSPTGGSAQQRFLTDCLIEYGLLPELCNRLTAILIFPEPGEPELLQIATQSVIPTFNKILGALGMGIQVEDDAVQMMVSVAKETRTLARGIKSIVSALVDEAVFEELHGTVRFGRSEVQRAIENAGLSAVAA